MKVQEIHRNIRRFDYSHMNQYLMTHIRHMQPELERIKNELRRISLFILTGHGECDEVDEKLSSKRKINVFLFLLSFQN